MIIDSKTFTEMAVHLRIASDAILKTAHHLTAIGSTTNAVSEEAEWGGTIDGMLSLSTQLRLLDRLLYAVLAANRDDGSSGSQEPPLPC
jgi:hypothetical protein